MARTAYTDIAYSGNAPLTTTLASGIAAGDTALTLSSATGWPTISSNGGFAVIDPGLSTEEKIYYAARSGTAVSSITRGVDDTSASSHSSGAFIYPIWTAVEANEANEAVVNTIGKVTTAGDQIVASGANAFARKAIGTAGQLWVVNAGATSPAWVSMSGDATMDSTGALALAAGSVGLDEISFSAAGYSANLVQSGAVTKTDTRVLGVQLGDLFFWNVVYTVTGSGTSTQTVVVNLPVTAMGSASNKQAVGTGYVEVAANATPNIAVVPVLASTTTLQLRAVTTGQLIGSGTGFTGALASGDVVSVSVCILTT